VTESDSDGVGKFSDGVAQTKKHVTLPGALSGSHVFGTERVPSGTILGTEKPVTILAPAFWYSDGTKKQR
jgi:hypothetical protein